MGPSVRSSVAATCSAYADAQTLEQRRRPGQARTWGTLVLDRVGESSSRSPTLETHWRSAVDGASRRCGVGRLGGLRATRRRGAARRELVVEAGRGPDPAGERGCEPFLQVREAPQAVAALGNPVGTPEAARHIDPGTAHSVQ